MRRAIIPVLILASGSAQASVQSIGNNQYVVTDAGKRVFAEASATCAQMGRTMMPLPIPREEAEVPFEKQFKFECILADEIVPGSEGTFTIHVPTENMLVPADRVCPPATCPLKVPITQLPDIGTASKQTRQLADAYCAKMHQTVVVTGGGFDMGPGLTFIFKCVRR